MDRRYQRTEKRLIEVVLGLIADNAFSDVTVADIAERADIARKTFYAHYDSKQDLLWHSLETHFQTLEQQTTDLNADSLLMDNKPLSFPVFKHVAMYAGFYRQMLMDADNADFVVRFREYIAQQSYQKHQPLREAAPFMTVPPELIAQMLAGALIGALRWWLRGDMQDTPEQMAYRFSQIVAPGVLQSMGLDALD
jgi:AcrR family transcriptional regulator